jgi:hypothetical protein
MGLTNNLGKLSNMITSTGSNVGINGTPTAFSTNVYFDVIGNTTTQGGLIQSRNSDNSIIGSFFTNANGLNVRTETTNPMLFSTAATERMRITSTGTVGIGTTTPTGLGTGYGTLDVRGTSGGGVSMGTSTTNGYIYTDTALRIQTNAAITFMPNNSEAMRITTVGNVGIGTSSPNFTTTNRTVLDINGTSTSLLSFSSGGSGKGYIFNDGTNLSINSQTGNISFSNSTAEIVRINNSGGIKIFNSTPSWTGNGMELSYNGTNSLIGSYDRSTSTYKQLYFYGSNTIFENGGSERMRITSTGNVGINNSGPTGKLHINSNNSPSITGTTPTGAFVIQSDATTALTMGVEPSSPFCGWLQMRHGSLSGLVYSLTLQPLGGNVGIGTIGPAATLSIKGAANNTVIEFENGGATKAFMRSYDRTAGAYREYEMLATDLLFSTGSSPSEKMRINSNGVITTPFQPAFRAYYSVNGFWNLNTNELFNFDSVEYNIGGCFNTSNGSFTAPVAGVYQFNFYTIVYGAVTNGAVAFRRNGVPPTSGHNVHFSPSVAGAWSNVVYTTSIYLNVGDYVQMYNTGGYTQYHGKDWSSFSGYLVG